MEVALVELKNLGVEVQVDMDQDKVYVENMLVDLVVVYQDQSQVVVCCLMEKLVDPEEALDHPMVDYRVRRGDHHLEPKVVQAY